MAYNSNDIPKPEQEPVGYWMGEFKDGAATLYEVPQESVFGRKYRNIPVYTTPPQRTLVALRDAQKIAIVRDCSHLDTLHLIELVETELMENNK